MVFPAKRCLLQLEEEETSVRRRPTNEKEKVLCMIMDDLCICKICKKLFSDMQGLKKHQMTHHSNPTFGDNSREIPQQFRNNNSISITRIQKEPSANVQSAIMQNQNSFRRVASAQPVSVSQSSHIRRNEIGRKVGASVTDGRAKLPIRSPDAKMKNAAASIRSMAPGVEADDDVTWQKWEPAHRDRDNGVANADGTIITPSAAERATSAFCSTSPVSPRVGGGGGGRKGVPQLLRMVSSNGKRPAPGVSASTQRANPSGGGVRGTANTSPVPDIMQNLGKIKSLNANRTTTKMISVPPPVAVTKKVAQQQLPKQKAQPPAPSFRVGLSKPPHMSKNKQKILPRNAYNNALPKPGAQKAPRLQVEDDEMDEDDDLMEEDEHNQTLPSKPPKLQLQPKNPPEGKTSVVSKVSGNVAGGGKVPPQKSLNKNRFDPLKNTKSSTAGEASSKNGKSSPDIALKSTVKEPAPVVAKKSAPVRKPSSTNTLMKMKMYVPKMPGTKYVMPSLEAVSSYTSRSGDPVWICLVCNDKESEESSRDMICCDSCEDWYHWECVGIFSSIPEDDPWYCKRCIFRASADPKKNFPTVFKSNAAP